MPGEGTTVFGELIIIWGRRQGRNPKGYVRVNAELSEEPSVSLRPHPSATKSHR